MTKTDARWDDNRYHQRQQAISFLISALMKMSGHSQDALRGNDPYRETHRGQRLDTGSGRQRTRYLAAARFEIKRGEWKDFSLDTLLTIASRLGLRLS